MAEVEVAGPSGDRPQLRLSQYIRLVYVIEFLAVLIMALIISWIVKYGGGFGDTLSFNYHPFFMLLGMIVIFGNSTLLYRIIREPRRRTVKYIHAATNAVSILCVVIALYAVFSGGGPVLYSIHSWAGITTVSLFLLQYVFAFLAFLVPGFAQEIRQLLLPYHKFIGLALFALASGTALAGITELGSFMSGENAYSKKSPAGFVLNFLGLSVIVYAACVAFLVTKVEFERKVMPEEQGLTEQTSL